MDNGLALWAEYQHPRDAHGKFAPIEGGEGGKGLAREHIEAGAHVRVIRPGEGASSYGGMRASHIKEVHEFDGSTGLKALIIPHEGKPKYLYTDEYHQRQADAKFERTTAMRTVVNDLQHKIGVDLESADRHTRALATVASLIDQHCIRVGGKPEEERTGSRGATTLEAQHCFEKRDGGLRLMFQGKSNHRWSVEVQDPKVAANIRAAATGKGPGQRLFNVTPSAINDYIKRQAGREITAKDFRTFHATSIVRGELEHAPVPATAKDVQRNIKRAIDVAARHLNHSPSICRENYVNPRVINEYELRSTPKVKS